MTESQRAKVTEADRAGWDEADRLAQRYEHLKSQGDAVQYSPEWLELVFAAGPRIQYRPVVSEAVAPYVKPETPVKRSLTGDEAAAFWSETGCIKPIRSRRRSASDRKSNGHAPWQIASAVQRRHRSTSPAKEPTG